MALIEVSTDPGKPGQFHVVRYRSRLRLKRMLRRDTVQHSRGSPYDVHCYMVAGA